MSSRVRQDEPPGRSRQRQIANLNKTTSPNFRLNFRLAFLSFVYFGKQPARGATGDLCKDAAKCPHLRIAHILAYMSMRLRRGATQPPVARRDARPLPWRRGFQPRCLLNVLTYNLTIIPSHCFRYLEFWSIGGLEIQTRSPKLRNSPQRKQPNAAAVETRGADDA